VSKNVGGTHNTEPGYGCRDVSRNAACITHFQTVYSVQMRKVIWGKSSRCLSRGVTKT